MTNIIDPQTLDSLKAAQKNEITEYLIYSGLAKNVKDAHNRQILETIAKDELKHYEYWKSLTHEEIKPGRLMAFWYILVSRIFGLSFGLKLMEKGEAVAIRVYAKLKDQFSETTKIMVDEQRHEKELLDILKEERVEYAGSVVLGLNDALVELTGALTGLTFALQNGKIIGITGLITGFAASLSMAASSYLSSKEEADQNQKKNPLKSAIYTGITYVLTVAVLITPYFFISNLYLALAVMLISSLLIICGYTFYITTAKSLKFWRRFLEMATLSLTVAVISFLMGWAIRRFLGVGL